MLKISVSVSNHVLRMERIPLVKHDVRLKPAEMIESEKKNVGILYLTS